MEFIKYYCYIDWYITKDKVSNFMAARLVMNYILTEWEYKERNRGYIKLSTSYMANAIHINNQTIDKSLKNLSELGLITIISKPHSPRKIIVNEALLEEIRSDYEDYVCDLYDGLNN